jgi:PAS domain S-box-containing protein
MVSNQDEKNMSDLSTLPLPIAVTDSKPGVATLALNDDGLIQGCSSACEKVFGYVQTELLGRHVSVLLPKLEGVVLVSRNEINPRLKYLCHCAIPFLAKRRDGRNFAGEVFFNRLNNGGSGLQVIVRNLGMMTQ